MTSKYIYSYLCKLKLSTFRLGYVVTRFQIPILFAVLLFGQNNVKNHYVFLKCCYNWKLRMKIIFNFTGEWIAREFDIAKLSFNFNWDSFILQKPSPPATQPPTPVKVYF